jgi:hypothetical protein
LFGCFLGCFDVARLERALRDPLAVDFDCGVGANA